MKPAQLAALAVAKDHLREAGFDEATLARMERAVDPNYTRDLCLRVGMAVRMLARQMAGEAGNRGDAEDSIDRIDVAEQTDLRLSPAESQPAAVATPPICPDCRFPMSETHSCRTVPRTEHVCMFSRADCWCAGLPGAGAG